MPIDVPLWLAKDLRRTKRCRIGKKGRSGRSAATTIYVYYLAL